jgi:hypothetical protein
MTPRKHQLEMFWLGATFTLLHFVSPVMWPFYSLTGFMLFLWAANVAMDWYERRLDARSQASEEVGK